MLSAREVSLENSHAVVVQLTAREIVFPPRWTRIQLVGVVVLDEFGAGGNRIFNHHVFQLRSVNGQSHGDGVARRRCSGKRDDVSSGEQTEVVALDVETKRTIVLV